jgi:hypothetical protein
MTDEFRMSESDDPDADDDDEDDDQEPFKIQRIMSRRNLGMLQRTSQDELIRKLIGSRWAEAVDET